MVSREMGRGGLRLVLLPLALLSACATASFGQQTAGPAAPDTPTPTPSEAHAPPPYKQLRYEEDWGYLRNKSARSERLDRIKYIPLRGREGWYVSIGGEARMRYERFDNPLWGQEAEDGSGYLLQRYMLHADFHLGPRVRFFGQIKSGLEDGRVGGARPTDEDRLDLHQAFLDLKFGAGKGRTLLLRAGRQEMSFGSSRLVGVRESPNVRQSFDGLRATLGVGRWRLDGFVTRPVETDGGVFDDAPDHARTFWGAYAVGPSNLGRDGTVDLYYLGIDRKRARYEQGAAREVRHSVGARIWGRRSAWDYNYELVYQWGGFGRGDIRAWTAASDDGYTLSRVRFRPRLGLKADVTSGDRDPRSPNLETFDPLFPRGAYFGEIALVGPANHVDLHPSLDLKVGERLTLTSDAAFFWRQNLNDGIYGNAVNLLRSGRASRARYVGSQPSLQAEWQLSRHVAWAGAYSYFFAGPFLRESGPGRDVSYVTAWLTYKF